MKPDFALNMSPDGLTLMYRVKRGWQIVGEASLDDPGLKTRLAEMRETAARLAPQGMRTKLILPESQVLNTSIPSPGPDDAARRAAVEQALDGMTPYALDELCFDWEAEGEVLHIAVVARETMAEAEAFAVDHQMNPVSLVALPRGGSFTGEPFFGETAAAADILPKGERVKRDLRPTIPTGRMADPAPEDAPAQQAAPEPTRETAAEDPLPAEVDPDPETAATADAQDAVAAPDTATDDPLQVETGAEEATEAETEAEEPVIAPETAAQPEAAQAPPEDESAPAAELAAEDISPRVDPDEDEDDPEAEQALAAALGATAPEPATDQPDGEDDIAERGEDDHQGLTGALAASEADPPTPSAETAADDPSDDAIAEEDTPQEAPAEPDAQPDLERPVFASKNRGEAPEAAPADAEDGTSDEEKAPHDEGQADFPIAASVTAPDLPSATDPPASIAAREVEETSQAGPETPPQSTGVSARFDDSTGDLPPIAPLPPPRPVVKADPATDEHPAPLPTITPAPKPAAVAAPLSAPPRPANAPRKASRASKPDTSVFGAKKPGRERSPLMGFALTAALLAFMAAAVLWSVIFDGDDATGPEIAALPEPAPTEQDPAPIEAAEPTEPPEIVAAHPPEPAPSLPSELAGEPSIAADPEIEAPQNPLQLTPAAEPNMQPTSDEDLAVEYAATGIWTRAPEPPAIAREGRMNAPLAVAIDPLVPQSPTAALPALGAAMLDAPPALQVAPPPPGATFAFDENGLILATPEGALTPEGTIVFLGRPPMAPAGRQGQPAAPEVQEAALPAEAATPDAALPFEGPRPRPRPEALAATEVPEVAADPLEGFRPRPRPATETAPEAGDEATLEAPEVAAATDAAETPAPDTSLPSDAAAVDPASTPETAPETATAEPETEIASDPALAGFRPRPRPAGIEEAAAIDAASRAAAAAAAAAVADAVANPLPSSAFENATDLAVAATPRPRSRPGNIAAMAPARSAPAQAPEAAAPAPAQAPAAAGPQIPTRASVASQATIDNAIRLNRTNLIGIYGGSADRRALIRLPSGRYVKVQVGDRVDGGQVAAISDSELRLVKNGRNVVLRVGQGG